MTEVSSRVEPVAIPNSRGEVLAGEWHAPTERASAGMAVVCHGMLSSKESEKHRAVCERLVAVGWSALRFDFAGRGDSQGDPELLTVSREVEDLTAVLRFVRDRVEQDLPLVLTGSSLGGTVAVLTAPTTPIAGLVTVGSPAHLPAQPRAEWGGSGDELRGRVQVGDDQWISGEFFVDAARHDVLRAARQVGCPWLVIHAVNDEVVAFANGARLAEAGSSTRFVVHPSAGHRFHEPEDQEWLVRQVVGFVSERSR